MAHATLISLGEVKDEIGMPVTDSDKDDVLQDIIDQVFSLWEELTERKWELAEYTEKFNGKTNMSLLPVSKFPIVSVVSLHDDTDHIFGDDTKLDAEDISFDSENGIVSYDGTFSKGFQNIKLVYTAGYDSTTVPQWLKGIVKRQVAHWHRQQTQNTSDLFSISIHAGGGTTSFKSLRDNLLPDFASAADRNRKMGF